MPLVPFTIVDVFSATAFKGNPLAVVDNTTANLTKTQMQFVARQFNLSETTFFGRPTLEKAVYALRSFLPDGREVFGAGHNILGVWWWLAKGGFLDLSHPEPPRADSDGTEEFLFWQELGGKVMPVKILRRNDPATGEPEISVSIRQVPPGAHSVRPDTAALAESIGLSAADIGFPNPSGQQLQPQVMSTATTRHLHVPVSSTAALNRVSVQRDKLLHQLSLVDDHAYGLFLFTPTPGAENSYLARFFSPGMSGEDPATGSAAGPLSAYLYNHGQLKLTDGVGKIAVQQGLAVGRECRIQVTLSAAGDGGDHPLEVDFAGGGVKVAAGEIEAPDPKLQF